MTFAHNNEIKFYSVCHEIDQMECNESDIQSYYHDFKFFLPKRYIMAGNKLDDKHDRRHVQV